VSCGVTAIEVEQVVWRDWLCLAERLAGARRSGGGRWEMAVAHVLVVPLAAPAAVAVIASAAE
jgi:hypothetical protein